MAQVTVTIAGKVYRMACGDGEESHLEGLAASFDGKIEEMRAAFGEIGDMRLHVMAALTVMDQLRETEGRLARLEQRLDALKGDAGSSEARMDELETRSAAAIAQAAQRIERIARALSAQG